jgi:hypothetical protein
MLSNWFSTVYGTGTTFMDSQRALTNLRRILFSKANQIKPQLMRAATSLILRQVLAVDLVPVHLVLVDLVPVDPVLAVRQAGLMPEALNRLKAKKNANG